MDYHSGSFIIGAAMTVDDTRAPIDRDEPVIRKSIGAAPVSRPAKTQEITEQYAVAKSDELTDAELGRSIVLTVALPAFVIGFLIGMLLL